MNPWSETKAWMDASACAHKDVNTFFKPAASGAAMKDGTRPDPHAEARALCAECTVRDQCLDYALTNRVAYGVWGGLDEKQRASILKAGRRKGAAA